MSTHGNAPEDHPGYASDDTTLVAVIAGFEAAGFTEQFFPLEGAVLRCASCRESAPAADFDLEAIRRTEGASDPADMVAVAALSCPRCGAKGTFTSKYGHDASIEESEALLALERVGGDGAQAGEVGLVEGAS